jgi:hypothetical protein
VGAPWLHRVDGLDFGKCATALFMIQDMMHVPSFSSGWIQNGLLSPANSDHPAVGPALPVFLTRSTDAKRA